MVLQWATPWFRLLLHFLCSLDRLLLRRLLLADRITKGGTRGSRIKGSLTRISEAIHPISRYATTVWISESTCAAATISTTNTKTTQLKSTTVNYANTHIHPNFQKSNTFKPSVQIKNCFHRCVLNIKIFDSRSHMNMFQQIYLKNNFIIKKQFWRHKLAFSWYKVDFQTYQFVHSKLWRFFVTYQFVA